MAILLFGKHNCTLCNHIIKEGEEVISFPPFLMNKKDPCYIFSDASFHLKCVQDHLYGGEAIKRASLWQSKTEPGKRQCAVCQLEVIDYKNYFLIENITQDEKSILYHFNYTHLHKSCISNWLDLVKKVDIDSLYAC